MKAFLVACVASLSLMACGELEGPPGKTGLPGDTGAPGPKGDKGDKGEPGAPGVGLQSATSCGATISSTRSLAYMRYVFADGSVMVTCELYSPSTVLSSGVAMHMANSSRAKTGECVVRYDFLTSPGTGGKFTFTSSGTSGSVEYNDPEVPSDRTTYSMQCYGA